MPNQTPNLGLYTWLENDFVDFDQMNYNFEKLDGYVQCIESGTATANYTQGSSPQATWYYKKYSDGSIEMWTKLAYSDLRCNGGSAAPYYSGNGLPTPENSGHIVEYPFTLSSVTNIQMNLASNTFGWVINITPGSTHDRIIFRTLSLYLETTAVDKYVYVNVKGVL